jgi:hypothetical protein
MDLGEGHTTVKERLLSMKSLSSRDPSCDDETSNLSAGGVQATGRIRQVGCQSPK